MMQCGFRALALGVLLAAGCATETDPLANYEELDPTTILDAPAATGVAAENREIVARGEYLVELLGCGVCHTDGAFDGEPDIDRWLGGSSVGIAWTNPMRFRNPGVVFPPNITPDDDTGIGRWSNSEIVAAIRAGYGRHGSSKIAVMPWQSYASLTNADVLAIVGYLRSIEPVRHRVPDNVPAGRKTSSRYVHFGVYRSR